MASATRAAHQASRQIARLLLRAAFDSSDKRAHDSAIKTTPVSFTVGQRGAVMLMPQRLVLGTDKDYPDETRSQSDRKHLKIKNV